MQRRQGLWSVWYRFGVGVLAAGLAGGCAGASSGSDRGTGPSPARSAEVAAGTADGQVSGKQGQPSPAEEAPAVGASSLPPVDARFSSANHVLGAVDRRVASLQESPAGPERPEDVAWVKARLVAMAEVAKHVRDQLRVSDFQGAEKEYFRAHIQARLGEIERAHARVLGGLIDRHGWFVISRFGEEAATAAWQVARFADTALQKRVLALIEPLLGTEEIVPAFYTWLYDSVAVAEGRLQRYGTQGACQGSAWVLAPMEDPERVDERRLSMQLPRLAGYVRGAQARCTEAPNPRWEADAAFERKEYGRCAELYTQSAEVAASNHVLIRGLYDAARCHALAGNKDGAFATLERLFASGFGHVDFLKDEEALRSLQDDPRWKALMDKAKSDMPEQLGNRKDEGGNKPATGGTGTKPSSKPKPKP